jgi:tetratricopeptide (TPR) repeat protein
MDPERWKRIELLYHAALEMKPEERDSFLARTCEGDVSLRGEIKSLLAVAEGADGYLKAAIAEAQGEGSLARPAPFPAEFPAANQKLERLQTTPVATVTASVTTQGAPPESSTPPGRLNWFAAVFIVVLLALAAAGFWLYQRNSAAQIEIAYWTSISDSKTSAPFEEYLRRYPEGQFSGQARAQIEALKSQQSPAFNPPTTTRAQNSLSSTTSAHSAGKSAHEPIPTDLPPARKPETPASGSDPYDQGETLLKSGSYAEAVSLFSLAIAARPDYRSYFGRAGAYQHLEKLDQAIDDYTQAIRYNPGSAMAYHERAVCLARSKHDDQALPDYNRAIDLSPGYALSWNGRGVIYLHRKDYQKAISDFTEAIRLESTLYQAYKNRAAARKAIGDIAGETADLNQASRLKP